MVRHVFEDKPNKNYKNKKIVKPGQLFYVLSVRRLF